MRGIACGGAPDMSKKRPRKAKVRRTWKIQPATQVHEPKARYSRKIRKQEVRKDLEAEGF